MLERRRLVEVATPFSLPLPTLSPFAVAALADPLDLGRGPLQGGTNLIGLQARSPTACRPRGLPAALAQPPGNHHPVALAEGVGQVLGLARQTFTLKNEVSPSRHWPSCWIR